MTHILWHSNAPHTNTGYGNQTAIFTPRLKRAGYDVTISAFYGREGAPAINEDGIMELPRLRDPYGNDVIEAHAQMCDTDLVLSLVDPFILNSMVWGELPWAAWVPVDSTPLLPENAAALATAHWIIAMSRFGEGQLRAAGFQHVHYVPLGVETNTFSPIDRQHARAELSQFVGRELRDKFLVISVAANKGQPSRKNFDGMLATFAMFATAHSDALLYLHTDANGLWGGEHLPTMAEAYGIADRVIFPPRYHLLTGLVAPPMLNTIYNAGDVFMLLSRGEGFGIPIVEAQAAGCPVIVTDCSAMPELVFAGKTVPGLPFMAATGAWGRLALVPKAAEALRWAYQQRGDEVLREQARQGALAYDVDHVFTEYMQPAVERMLRQKHAQRPGQRFSR